MPESYLEKLKFNIPLWPHQAEDLKRAEYHPGYGFFWEMGLGKTAAAIHYCRMRYALSRKVVRTLILGPKIVVPNWEREFKMHSKVSGFVHALTGTGKKKVEVFKRNRKYEAIFITNYEALNNAELFDLIYDWQPELLILDESHRLKDGTSKRTKLSTKLADRAAWKVLLTGTPITNTPADIYSQYRILDGGETFGRSFLAFRNRYFYDANAMWSHKENYFPDFRPIESQYPELQERIKQRASIRKKDECLSLPPLVKKIVTVELSREQQRHYKEMKNDLLTYINDQACVAKMALTKALRLQQIVTGFVTVEGEEKRETIEIKKNPRLEALKELLREITVHSKCIVWAVFRHNYRQIASVCEALELDFVEVHGAVDGAAKQEAIDKFNNDENCKVFIGNTGSAGIGINLVVASYSIFYSRNFSLEQYLQAQARNHRAGCEHHDRLTEIHLVAEDTMDEITHKRVSDKEEMTFKVLHEALKDE